MFPPFSDKSIKNIFLTQKQNMAHKLENLLASHKTHNLLVSFQQPFHKVDKTDADFNDLSEATWRKHNHETRPAIFINKKFIGGYEKLDELNQNNKLKELLA